MALAPTTLDASHFEMSPSKEEAPRKRKANMVFTRDVPFRTSPLKTVPSSNILFMLVTPDTFTATR